MFDAKSRHKGYTIHFAVQVCSMRMVLKPTVFITGFLMKVYHADTETLLENFHA